MKTRVLSGLIMLPLLVILIFNGYVLYAGCFVVGIMAVYEFFKGFHSLEIKPNFPIAVCASIALYALGLVFGIAEGALWYLLWIMLVVLSSLLYLFKMDERKLEDGMVTIVGIMYVVFFCWHIAMIGQIESCSIMVWLVVITAFGSDICAYFAGYCLGKHKLCPKISPKKTVEGAIGGVLGSVILSGIFGLIFAKPLIIHCLIIGLLGSVISMFGDLTASVFKRKMGIKDYGNLIPGHGGILDRFDSVLFTGPLVFYYTVILMSV